MEKAVEEARNLEEWTRKVIISKDFKVETEIDLEEIDLEQDISSFGVMEKAVEEAGNLEELNEKGYFHADFPVSWKKS